MQRDIEPDTNQSPTKHPLVAQLEREADSANATRDEQPRSTVDEGRDTFHADQDATNMLKGQSNDEDQVHVEADSSHGPPVRGSDWSSRIRASIARLMEIDGISLDPENTAKIAEKATARTAEQAFSERVDQLEAATVTAHKEYSDRLRHVYSASTAKKMKLTSAKPLRTTVTTQPRDDYESLDALAVAAASGARHVNGRAASMDSAATNGKKAKRTYSLLHNSLPLRDRASDGADTNQNPVQVHDPTLTQAVDKLTNKLRQLLVQLEAASDAAAVESIMAAAATIASETMKMGRCEEEALARIMEIEEHRLQIMHGLLEYAKRKEERKNDEEVKGSASDSPVTLPLLPDTNAEDVVADEKQTETQ